MKDTYDLHPIGIEKTVNHLILQGKPTCQLTWIIEFSIPPKALDLEIRSNSKSIRLRTFSERSNGSIDVTILPCRKTSVFLARRENTVYIGMKCKKTCR